MTHSRAIFGNGRFSRSAHIRDHRGSHGPDLIVDEQVIVELKCVDKLIPVHEAQILAYMKLAGTGKGLLLNFQSRPLINGLKRFVL